MAPLEIARTVAGEIAVGAGDRDLERRYPSEQLKVVRDAGLEGILVSPLHGGPGASVVDALEVTAILAEGDPNVAHMYGNIHLFGTIVASNLAPEAVAAELNSKTVRRQLRWGNAFSERKTKSAFHWDARLTPHGDDWKLDGEKFYCTGSVEADWLFVLAHRDGTEEMRLCLVPASSPGVEIIDDWSGMGQATTGSGTTRFTNVTVRPEYALDASSMMAPTGLAGVIAQATFSAVHLGIARNAVGDAIDFVATKARPPAFSPAERASVDTFVLRTIGVMRTQLSACEGMHRRMLDAIGEALSGVPVPPGHVACTASSAEARAAAAVATYEAKAFTGETGLKLCEMLFQVCGASSTLEKYNFDRHWRNLRTVSLHDAVDYKYLLIGDYHQNGAVPPVTAQS